nr:FeoC-like transcriptional regulator [uncultured Moellerella sp.]
MASLLQIRDLVALHGQADIRFISHQLSMPVPLVQAMLEQLVAMGKVEKIDISKCLTSSGCRSCPEGQKCANDIYQLRQ